MFAKTFGLLNTRTTSFGVWLLLLHFSTTFLWAGRFPTDFHLPSLAEAHDLLKAICPGDATDEGCMSCPDFMPEGAAQTPIAGVSFVLQDVLYGSFTRQGIREAVAAFRGCASHAGGFGTSVLLEKTASGWKFESFGGPGLTNECLRYPLKSGRQLLVCKGEWGGQGELWRWLTTIDYSLPERSRADNLLTTYDTFNARLSEKIVGVIEDVQLRDLNHDGMPDLAVYVKAARIQQPPGSEQDCAQPFVPPAIRVREVDFLFSEDKFELAPWSVHTIQELNHIFAPYKARK